VNIKNKFLVISFLLISVLLSLQFAITVIAEQGGSSPESSTTSRLKTISNSLTTLGFGSTNSGSWGDWGGMWNRIYSAAIWTPNDATAVNSNVTSGKTFYAGSNRVKQTGLGSLQPTPTPGSPAVGDDSRLNTLYKALVTLNFGSDSAGSWGDWGAMLNRIYSAATWTPSDADAVAGDVSNGKTFYSGDNRIIKTGTYDPYALYTNQSLCIYENSGVPCLGTQAGAGTWTRTNSTTGSIVWKDNKSGLYWTENKGYMSNAFSLTCSYFSTIPRGAYSGSACGLSIQACGSLEQSDGFSVKTDWYLPSYQELKQAFIDGMYSTAGSSFTTTNSYWSSTEKSTSNHIQAMVVWLNNGSETFAEKSYASYARTRCVRRD
jgi:hypothetical protein